jgi:hypothetical protein
MMIRAAATLTFTLVAASASATPLRDPSTGLAVDPPATYSVQAGMPDAQHAARITMKRPDDIDGGCELGFSASAANARLSQAQINALVGGDEGQERAKAVLGPVYDVLSTTTTDLGPIRALVLQADFKPRPELPPRARQVRSYFAILETPRGRTTLVCVADRTDFAGRFAEFGAILRSVAAP